MIDWTGTVVGAGDGIPEDIALGDRSQLPAGARHLRIAGEGRVFTFVAYGIANFGSSIAAGIEVELAHRDATRSYIAAPRGPVETVLRTQRGVELHYAFSSSSVPPGFSVARGEEYCAGHDYCRTWGGHALEVGVADSPPVSVRPGEAATVGNYTIYAGVVRRAGPRHEPTDEDRGLVCSEATPSATEFLIVRSSVEEP